LSQIRGQNLQLTITGTNNTSFNGAGTPLTGTFNLNSSPTGPGVFPGQAGSGKASARSAAVKPVGSGQALPSDSAVRKSDKAN
jgi:hypothetical protein